MYDARREPREFAATSRDEAVAKACSFFGVSAQELDIREVGPGRVFGVGSRVLVIATPRDVAPGGRDRSRVQGPVEEEQQAVALTQLSEIGRFVLELVDKLGVGSFDLSESKEGDNTILHLRGPGALKLTGGDGRALDALQLLVNQVALRKGAAAGGRIVVDADSHPERRKEYLERLAARAARRAKETQRGVALDPMNPRDRRIVHTALREVPGVATMSVGEGRYRQVVVVPEGAPEYEQALRYEASVSREEGAS